MEKLVNIGVTYGRDFPVDRMYVQVDFEDHFDTVEECTRDYNERLGRVRAALAGVGIPEEEIKNGEFEVHAHTMNLYEKDDDRFYRATTRLDGYDYSADVSVARDADTELAKRIWVALCSYGKETSFRLHFGIADRERLKTTLLTEAVAEGRRQADILAAAAGMRVTGVHSINYQYDGGGYRDYALCAPSDGGGAYDSAPEFNPKDVYVECRVQMQWEMGATE